MIDVDAREGMAANNNDRLVEHARLQQEIARLQQNVKSLRGGTCPLSGQRVRECANHQERHAPLLKAQAKVLARLKRQEKTYTAA